MKLLIIGAFALLLLGGGGAGAYFYFQQPAEAAADASGEHAAPAKKAEGGHGGGESTFVQLTPLILPVIGKNGMTQTVSMVIVIETADAANQAKIEHLAPRLKDAFIQDMYGALSQDIVMQDGVIQVNAIKTRLHRISQKVLGEEVAKEVLLQVVQQRPI